MTSVGATDLLHLTLTSNQGIGFNGDGVEPPGEDDYFNSDRAEVDPGFFTAASIPLLHGRNFTDADLPDNQAVAIVGEATATRFWPDSDAIGQTLRRPGDNPDLTIVGVAADTNIRTIGEAPRLMVYRPFSQRWAPSASTVW